MQMLRILSNQFRSRASFPVIFVHHGKGRIVKINISQRHTLSASEKRVVQGNCMDVGDRKARWITAVFLVLPSDTGPCLLS